jgi:hypothetical protein
MNYGLARRNRGGFSSGTSMQGGLGYVPLGLVQVWYGLLRHGNQARAGTGPDQRRRLGVHCGRLCRVELRFDSARPVDVGHVLLMPVWDCLVWSWLNRHRGRRGEASTPRGGMY